ncbi:MAG: hypothetical protein QW578_06685 [Thermoplasmatales archaeon]
MALSVKFSSVVMFEFAFAFIFYTFSYYFFGTSMIDTSAITNISTSFSPSRINTDLTNLIGTASSWGIWGFMYSSVHAFLTPFAYIYQFFLTIDYIFKFIGSFLYYPYSVFPSPLNTAIPTFFIILLTISILTSLRFTGSGIE